jgi:hypothetical protein
MHWKVNIDKFQYIHNTFLRQKGYLYVNFVAVYKNFGSGSGQKGQDPTGSGFAILAIRLKIFSNNTGIKVQHVRTGTISLDLGFEITIFIFS